MAQFKTFFIEQMNDIYEVKYLPIAGRYYREQEDWRNFPVGKLYKEGDVHKFILNIHKGFEDDFRVNGKYKLSWVSPNTLPDSEWDVDETKVDELAAITNQLPPIVVNKNGDIVDGGHRLAAAKKTGKNKILAFIQQ